MIKILVVDDDKLIRWSLKEIFSQEGYGADTVSTVEEALELMKSSPYNLIFADLEINDDDGIEMLKKTKELQQDSKIIILSALTKQDIEPQLGDLNIFSIVEKPFESKQILSIARDALALSNQENGGDYRIKENEKNGKFIKKF